jgi:hypothetical protein
MLNSVRLIGCYNEYKSGAPIKICNDTEYTKQDSTKEGNVIARISLKK